MSISLQRELVADACLGKGQILGGEPKVRKEKMSKTSSTKEMRAVSVNNAIQFV
jgi:hypothetical protein